MELTNLFLTLSIDFAKLWELTALPEFRYDARVRLLIEGIALGAITLWESGMEDDVFR